MTIKKHVNTFNINICVKGTSNISKVQKMTIEASKHKNLKLGLKPIQAS
jgi:hypothetical protein